MLFSAPRRLCAPSSLHPVVSAPRRLCTPSSLRLTLAVFSLISYLGLLTATPLHAGNYSAPVYSGGSATYYGGSHPYSFYNGVYSGGGPGSCGG